MKALLLIAAVGLSVQVKAQQKDNSLKPLVVSPLDMKADSSLLKQLGKNNNLQFFKMPQVTAPNTQQLLSQIQITPKTITVNDKMPRVNTYNVDHMPIVKTDEPGMKYTMLIKRGDIDSKPMVVPQDDTVRIVR